MHGACAGVELERCVVPSEALVAALDSAHRALNDVYRWVVRSGELGAGSEEWGAGSEEWGAESEEWGAGRKGGGCLRAGIVWVVVDGLAALVLVAHRVARAALREEDRLVRQPRVALLELGAALVGEALHAHEGWGVRGQWRGVGGHEVSGEV